MQSRARTRMPCKSIPARTLPVQSACSTRASIQFGQEISRDRRVVGNIGPPLKTNRLVQHALCNVPLGGFRYADTLRRGENRYRVSFGVEADAFPRNIIDYDGVERFRHELFAGVLNNILSFGGEPDHDLRCLSTCDFGKDICSRVEL